MTPLTLLTPPPADVERGLSKGWLPNLGDLPESWIGHCNDCVQPIVDVGRIRRAVDWACYHLVTASPWLLWPLVSRAGDHAYQCQCANRVAAIADAIERGDHKAHATPTIGEQS